MGRKARFAKNDFITAALDLLAEAGPGGVTMAGIAERTGAPVGSVYHRFASREVLLAELWVELIASFQSGFLAQLEKGDGLQAALHTLRWIRTHPNKARVFLLYRREQLMAADWPAHIKDSAEELAARLNQGVVDFTRRFFGTAGSENMARVAFCLIHVPSSVARDCLESATPIPEVYDRLIEETYQSVLAPFRVDAGPKNKKITGRSGTMKT